jgi:hypothetical protein
MEFFLPSLLIVLLALGIGFGLFSRMAPFMLAIFAGLALIIAVRHHRTIFKQDYETMTWTTAASSAAPYILVATVVAFSIGYLLYLFGAGKKTSLPLPPSTIPPPETATNLLTSAIGKGLNASGLTTVSSNRANGNGNGRSPTLNTAQLESVASKIA